MRRDDQRQAVKNIPLEQLKPFKNHPFQVRDDEEFRRLVESIEIHGVIHPAVARQIGEDCYELISGHRRKAACEVLGYSEMPVLVRSMTDDEAVVNMVDANLQRETILPSERAFAYKMKLVAMSHQGRKGFTSAQLGRKCVGKESRELIAEQVGQSRNQISRYIRLTELIPEILEMVDNRKMALNPAVSISYLDKKQQKLLYKVMVALKATPSISQAKAIREKASESDFTEDYLVCILSEKKPNQREPMIVEEEEIKQYFPSHYNSEQMHNTILFILKADAGGIMVPLAFISIDRLSCIIGSPTMSKHGRTTTTPHFSAPHILSLLNTKTPCTAFLISQPFGPTATNGVILYIASSSFSVPDFF